MAAEIAFPDPPLSDEVVALRPWREDDVPERIMGFAAPSVLRFSWPKTTLYTEADARTFFEAAEAGRQRGEELHLAFTMPEDRDAVIGGGSLHELDASGGRAAVGYWVMPAARGRGVATHATLLIAGWAFHTLGLGRLELTCAPDNPASMRVAERCGFTREALLRSHMAFQGGRRDTVVFSLLPGELLG